MIDGAAVDPVPLAPTLDDATGMTIAVDLSDSAEPRPTSPISASLIADNSYRRRILQFVQAARSASTLKVPSRGLLDVAFTSMQTMQDTIARLRLSAYPPDMTVEVPRNACGFFEFWRAEELISLGRERADQAFELANL